MVMNVTRSLGLKLQVLARGPVKRCRHDRAVAGSTVALACRRRVHCFGSFLTLMEVFYRVWKDQGEAEGRLAYEQCLSLPLEWVHEDPSLLERAAEIKATHPVSLADAWIAATAILNDAALVHKDPEFELTPCEQVRLPHRSR